MRRAPRLARATGCAEPHCTLCQHSINRLCTREFSRKYLVDDVIKPRCGATLRIELIGDRAAARWARGVHARPRLLRQGGRLSC